MKYLYEDGNLMKVKEEGLDVALSLAMGTDYGQFDIDPFEAAVLVSFVNDYAYETGNTNIIDSCKRAMKDLKVHIEAFAIIVEHGG